MPKTNSRNLLDTPLKTQSNKGVVELLHCITKICIPSFGEAKTAIGNLARLLFQVKSYPHKPY
jgi:hypothetical protein